MNPLSAQKNRRNTIVHILIELLAFQFLAEIQYSIYSLLYCDS